MNDEHVFDPVAVAGKQVGSQVLLDSLVTLENALSTASPGNAEVMRQARAALVEVRQEIRHLIRDQLELTTLYRIGRQLASILELNELLGFILDQAIHLVGAERGLLVLCQGTEGDFVIPLIRGIDRFEIEEDGKPAISQQLIQHVLLYRQPLISTDAQNDSRFSASSSVVALQIRSVLAAPLLYQQELIGAIYLDTRMSVRTFEDDDLDLLTALANQVAVAIHIAQLYDDLKSKNKELAAMLQELHEAQEELIRTERLSAIGQMSASIIHDIRGPLTNVKGFAELLGKSDLTDEQRVQFSETISRTVDRFTGMTQEILDYARGEQTLRLEVVNVSEFLMGFRGFISTDFTDFDIVIRLDVGYEGVVRVDRQKLWRAFYNIAKNAAEAMAEIDGERLFTISSSRDGQWVEFILADTGPGISPRLGKTIFQPFATYGKSYGTGLGLSITKSIVEAHGGKIWFVTEPGKGTAFHIRIPSGEINA